MRDHGVTGITTFPLQFFSSRGMLPDIRDRHIHLSTKQKSSRARAMERAVWCSRDRIVLAAAPVAVGSFAFERGASRLFSGARCPLFTVLAEGAPWHRLLLA